MKAGVLLFNTDPTMDHAAAAHLTLRGMDTLQAASEEECLHHLTHARWDALIIHDDRRSDAAIDLVRRAHRRCPDLAIVLVTAQASLEATSRAIREGVFDILVPPLDHDGLYASVSRACESRRTGAAIEPPDALTTGGPLIGQSAAMVGVYKTLARVAPTRATVLILGESGTGKELVARALHDLSERSARRCVVIDCTAIPKPLLESELFGHVRGAFTGAVADKRGLLEQAHGSTCLLDEIGELAPDLQAKLLRILQEGELRKVGGQSWTPVDVRVVAATNRDLMAMVRDGTFREDLFYRLNVVTIQLPPLRDRAEDIPVLAHYFLRRAAERHGRRAHSLSRGALGRLVTYRWPGNVRQLQNTIERAVALSTGRVIGEGDLPREILGSATSGRGAERPDSHDGFFSAGDTLEDMKKRYILHVVNRTRGNIARAAAQLDIDRRSLYRMIARYKVEVPGRGAYVA